MVIINKIGYLNPKQIVRGFLFITILYPSATKVSK
jgi:hypothetical protein